MATNTLNFWLHNDIILNNLLHANMWLILGMVNRIDLMTGRLPNLSAGHIGARAETSTTWRDWKVALLTHGEQGMWS